MLTANPNWRTALDDDDGIPAVTGDNNVKVQKVKEADLYSAFVEVPYTQGAQVRITQCQGLKYCAVTQNVQW